MVNATTGEKEKLDRRVFVTMSSSMEKRLERARLILTKNEGLEGLTDTALHRRILMRAVDAIIEAEDGRLPLGK